jgi:hypothetical protein
MFYPDRAVTCTPKIRVVASVIFRKWFGHAPNGLTWHVDGFMAEAHDKRGNCIEVHQHNRTPIPRERALWRFPSNPFTQRSVAQAKES